MSFGYEMADVLTKQQRSYCMSQVRGRNTKLEVTIRKLIWQKGFRYRIEHGLKGKPDMVFPFYNVVVFIDGCFWHSCPKHYRPPSTNKKFWNEKISKNKERDNKINIHLKKEGWRVIRVWEHDVNKGPEKTANKIIKFLLKKNKHEKY